MLALLRAKTTSAPSSPSSNRVKTRSMEQSLCSLCMVRRQARVWIHSLEMLVWLAWDATSGEMRRRASAQGGDALAEQRARAAGAACGAPPHDRRL